MIEKLFLLSQQTKQNKKRGIRPVFYWGAAVVHTHIWYNNQRRAKMPIAPFFLWDTDHPGTACHQSNGGEFCYCPIAKQILICDRELILRQDVPLCGGVARSAGVVREFENIHLLSLPVISALFVHANTCVFAWVDWQYRIYYWGLSHIFIFSHAVTCDIII